ncbi:MAG: hypothetical protein M0001_05670 [Treponema sp.]|nr:hypothetical protein [Treponema sp.]
MRCEKFLDRFDSLEPGRKLPFRHSWHLAHCAACRARVDEFESAIAAWKDDEFSRYVNSRSLEHSERRAMASIRLMPRAHREFGLVQWMFPGFLVAISCIGLPLVARFYGVGNNDVFFPLALVFGLGLTAFGSIFASSHAVELKSELDRRLEKAFGTTR